ncbi:UDP-N-acetylmuramoyl-tripeptide--D-alanyl-D-alanine ligase [bacterium]|nr:UDP-N-acetylmuramoyl-tripeptide--D-alanyl-D-alanine ligase [bacterium]
MPEGERFRIGDILPVVGGWVLQGNPEVEFDGYCIDSRYVDGRSIFVPLMGQSRDGHQFVIDAVHEGAVAAFVRAGHQQVHEIVSWLSERSKRGGRQGNHEVCLIEVRHTLVALQKLAEWFRLQFDAKVVGITGSVGKTGTKEMLIQLLSTKYPTVGTEKNFNNEIGVPLALAQIRPRTKMAVIEMAMRARGEVSLLSRITRPDLAIITNTTASHVGRLGSFDEIYKAKCEIVDGLAPEGTVILNRRDENAHAIAAELRKRAGQGRELDLSYFDTSAAFLTSGMPPFMVPGSRNGEKGDLPKADVWVEDVELEGLDGSTFTLCTDEERVAIKLNILGRGSVENLTAAAAAAVRLGISLDEIGEAAPDLLPAPQRLNLFQLADELFLVDDCYNSSPASALDSLEFMLNLDNRYRKILILGDMLELGKFETLLHRQYAQAALSHPFHTIYAVGPRMNAVNEVEGREDIELYYVEGSSNYKAQAADHSSTARFGQTFGGGQAQRREGRHEILDDRAAAKLSALLLNLLGQDDSPTVILVKGARALHLERVVNDVLSEIHS